ncbi:MAG: hypothetical protein NVSMB15_00390 [Steroidobacteraceae bacterium]
MNRPEVTRSVVVQPAPAVSLRTQSTLQQSAEKMLVRALPQIRYRLMRTGPAGLAGAAVLIAAGVAAFALLLPAHQSVVALRTELTQAAHTTPAAAQPDQGTQQFAAALPTRAQVPALLGVVLVQATDSGIVLEQGKYTFTPAAPHRLARYTFEFPVKGNYGNIRNFINKSLAAIPALGVDRLHLERKNVGDTLVSADVGFVIYLRGA